MYIRKFRELQNLIPLPAPIMKVGGEFRCVLMNSMGGVVRDTGWFSNLLTNVGLTNLSTQNWHSQLHIGQGSSAPAFTDSALQTWLAYGNVNTTAEGPVPVGPNYEWYETRSYRFNAGVGTGTVRELGLSHLTTNSSMTVRSAVSPAVPKAVDQVLDVYYRFKIWPSLADVVGTIAIAGEDFNYTLRAMELDYTSYMRTFDLIRFTTSGSGANCWQDNIGSVTSAPAVATGSGGTSNAETHPVVTSAPTINIPAGSAYIDTTYKWALDEANSPGGVRSISTRMMTVGTLKGVQCQFNRVSDAGVGKIMKDNTKEISITFRMNYAR